MDSPKASSVVVGVRPLPDDLVSEVLRAEDGIEQQPEIRTRRRVAVEIERACRLEDPVELDEANGHLDEVGHHLVLADPGSQCRDDRADLVRNAALVAGCVSQESVRRLGARAPVPRVFEGEQLSVALAPRLILEDDVVVAVRVERRIEIDEVDRRIFNVPPEDVEVIPVVEDIRLHVRERSRRRRG